MSLLGITLATLPGTIGDYLTKLPTILPWLTPGKLYHWERQATFQGFWRLIFQGPVSGPAPMIVQILWPICAASVAIGIAVLLWRARGRRDDLGVIAACLVSMPLVMPYFMDYDLLLLAVPATLMARQISLGGRPLRAVDRACLATCGALFLWLFIGPALPTAWRVSLTVPLLTTLSVTMIVRAARGLAAQKAGNEEPQRDPQQHEPVLSRAA
jgi:hypothetical protein